MELKSLSQEAKQHQTGHKASFKTRCGFMESRDFCHECTSIISIQNANLTTEEKQTTQLSGTQRCSCVQCGICLLKEAQKGVNFSALPSGGSTYQTLSLRFYQSIQINIGPIRVNLST